MSKARSSSTSAPAPSVLQQAEACRARGDVLTARVLARRVVAEGGPDVDPARRLLTLIEAPRGVYVQAGVAAVILILLVTLATLRS